MRTWNSVEICKSVISESEKALQSILAVRHSTLTESAYGNEARQIGLLKAALLTLKRRPTRYLAIKYEKEQGHLLQRLVVSRCERELLKTVKEAVEAVEDFLWF